MNRITVLLIFLLLPISFLTVDAQEQQPAYTALQLGTPIERTIAANQSHLFSLTLEAGQFAQVVVEQNGIDVIISVTGPNSKKVGDFDSPNGDQGPENVAIVAETAGEYFVTVRPLNEGQNVKPGKYEIRLMELRSATDQELTARSSKEALHDKALELVNNATLLIPQIRSLPMRVHGQMKAADLLWATDEKIASKLMADAVAALKEYIASIDYGDPESIQYLQQVNVLRYELIQGLATHDAEAALNFLRSTRLPVGPGTTTPWGAGEREDQLELTLASQIAQQDPKRAYQIAQENLKTRLSTSLLQAMHQLLNKDPELGRKLARDINAKLMEEKLLKNREAVEVALNLLRAGPYFTVYQSRVLVRTGSFQDVTTSIIVPNSQPGSEATQTPLLSVQERHDLLQKVLSEALTPAPANPNSWSDRDVASYLLEGLKQIGPELEAQFPGSQLAVEKRMNEIQGQMDPQRATWQKYEQALNNTTPDAAAETISQSPLEIRTQLYQQLADRTAANGDINRARQIINARIKEPWQRRQALQNLDQQAIYQNIAKGNFEEALRALSTFRPLRQRASIIAQVARQIGPGRKTAAAIALLEQARSLLGDSPLADNQDEMQALCELATAFNRYDTKRAFQIVDPLIDQFNEINDAARKLSGFGPESHKDGEVDMYNGNFIMSLSQQLARALASLAPSDFEKTKAAADRIQAPEVRLVIYLTIAEQLLTSNR